jgi:HK97 family phage major capsid protein
MDNLLQRQRAYKADRLLREMLDSWEREQKDRHQLSAWRAIQAASRGVYRQEAPAEFAQWGCIDGDDHKIPIPLGYLGAAAHRDLTAGGADSAGGYLVTEQVRELAYPLSGSGVGRAGATFVLNATRDQKIPALAATPNFEWLANESAALTPDTAITLSAVSTAPKVGGIPVIVSRQLQKQTNIATIINQLLTQVGNDALDIAALNGSGASGQPLGLLVNTDVPSVSGATMNILGLAQMEELAVQNGADDTNLTWVAATNTRRILRQREISTGSGSIWPDNTLLGHRALVSPKMPSASLLVGDFANLTIILFGPGLEVLVDPYSAFKTGQITFQLRMSIGVLCAYPASFRKATSIT